MEVESENNNLNNNLSTPAKKISISKISKGDTNASPIVINDDSPDDDNGINNNNNIISPSLQQQLQYSQQKQQNELRSTMIDENIINSNSNSSKKRYEEQNIQEQLHQLQQQQKLQIKEEDLCLRDFKKHIDNIKLFAQTIQEKENNNSNINNNNNNNDINKQIIIKNNLREQHLIDTINSSKLNDFNIFKESQNEEFKMKLKQKDLALQQKLDENNELLTKIKMLEQKINSQETDLVQMKQVNREYQQQMDNQKTMFERKIQKVMQNQENTSDINSQWKAQLYEQKCLSEELQRKVNQLENKLNKTESENQSMAEKNMELTNQNFDLKEEIEKNKREYSLLKAEKRQEDGIFDEFGNQQNKFIHSLQSYSKDLKDVFDQINNNPIIEKYKKQNDELIIDNTNLREQVIRLNQEISDKQIEDIQRSIQDSDRLDELENNNTNNNNNQKSNALVLYENMMQKFTEMDERMVLNDNEKFEALQQKDFWFNKSQQLEQEVISLKELIKQLTSKNEEYEYQLSQYKSNNNNKKITTNSNNNNNLNQTLNNNNNNKTKKRRNGNNNNNNLSDVEEDISNVIPVLDKKLKTNNIDSHDNTSSPAKSVYEISNNNSNTFNNNSNNFNKLNNINNNNQVKQQLESIPNLQQSNSINLTKSTSSNNAQPIKNTSLFQLKICIKCNLNIKKLQEYETCSTCRKDYHAKCKGENIVGSFCNNCHEKEKKRISNEMEVEKQGEITKKSNDDMIPEN